MLKVFVQMLYDFILYIWVCSRFVIRMKILPFLFLNCFCSKVCIKSFASQSRTCILTKKKKSIFWSRNIMIDLLLNLMCFNSQDKMKYWSCSPVRDYRDRIGFLFPVGRRTHAHEECSPLFLHQEGNYENDTGSWRTCARLTKVSLSLSNFVQNFLCLEHISRYSDTNICLQFLIK